MRDYVSDRVFDGVRYLTPEQSAAHQRRFMGALLKRDCISVPAWVSDVIDESVEEQNPLRAAINEELRKPMPWRPKKVQGQ